MQKSLKIVIFEICKILTKKILFQKIFFKANFINFEQNIFFSHFRISEHCRFLGYFSKKYFFKYFFNTKSRNVTFSQDVLFLMLCQEKMTKLEKKMSFWPFFWKNQFFVYFRIFEIFLGSRYCIPRPVSQS